MRTWLHGEFLLVEGTKMSKRYWNFLTLRDLRDAGKDPAALRFLFASTQYRKQLNFTDDALDAAHAGTARLAELRSRLARTAGSGAGKPLAPLGDRLASEFTAAMDDDLDTPRALAALMEFARAANAALDAGGESAEDRRGALDVFDRTAGVLQVVGASREITVTPAPGVVTWEGGAPTVTVGPPGTPVDLVPPAPGEDLDTWAARVAGARRAARMAKDWPRADLARKLLAEQEYEVRDNPDGTPLLLRKRPPTAT